MKNVLRHGPCRTSLRLLSTLALFVAFTSDAVPFALLPAHAAPSDAFFADRLQPFLKRYCFDCHGSKQTEADLRLDARTWQLTDAQNLLSWEAVFKRLEAGEMPPKSAKLQPTTSELKTVRDGLRERLATAMNERRKVDGRSMVRRLNRVEYQHTLHDLLDIDIELKELLPEDPVSGGFDNVDEALRISAVQMERYLAAAESALDAAIVKGSRPETKTRRLVYKEIQGMKQKISEGRFIAETPDAAVLFHAGYTPYEPRELWQTPPGRYKIRISAYGYQTSGQPAVMGVYFGNFIVNAGRSHLVGYFDVPPDKPKVVEFEERFTVMHDTVKPVPYGGGDPWRNDGKIQEHTGPGLAVQWIEVEGPLVESWPPESHRRLFGDVDLSRGMAADAERLLRVFLPQAFRRPVMDDELKHYTSLAKARLDAGKSFEQALRFAYTAVLCSPNFLLLGAKGSPSKAGDDYFLASRLSYFLWNSMPDRELMRLAERGELSRSDLLRGQVERMLKDDKSQRFIENFIGQWLSLRNIDFTTPDKQLYPEFDEFLQVSMVRETHRFFEEILRNDLSLLNFVDSDWGMLNRRLAEHYGIPHVTSAEFQKVSFPSGSHRGGVLAQASVLKVTANGTNTSPVIRGAWVLDRILGTPASPPPANVPAVEPDIRGATTIREQLAKHKTDAACASCHRQIDPPGFALENFDVIGGWRDNYRIQPEPRSRQQRERIATSRGERWIVHGPAVDAADSLPNGKRFADVDEFKRLLLADPDQIARGLTTKLLVFASGHPIELADKPVIDEIVQRTKMKKYGLRSLIHELVQSEAFKSK